MGLDMWLRKVQKPEMDLSSIKTVEDASNAGLTYIEKENLDTPAYEDLKDYVVTRTLAVEKIDLKKIMNDYDLDVIVGRSKCRDNFGFSAKNGKKATISKKEMEEKYVFTEQQEFGLFQEEEVYYWRKAYDIQDFFYERHNVENCGYHAISKYDIEYLNEVFDEEVPTDCVDELNENEALFYHEWY